MGPTPQEENAAPVSRAAALAPAAVAAVAIAALLGDACWGATVYAFRDMHRVYLPARRFLAEHLARLEWPEWYPYDGLGAPLAGHVVTGIFHPTALLHAVLPRVLAFNFSVALAHALAILGTWLLLRRWGAGRAASLAGALAYGLCGYLVSMDGNLPYLLAASAAPLFLWGLEVGSAAGVACAAGALASAALASDPQAAFTMAALGLAAALFPAEGETRLRRLGALALACALGGLLSAVQVLPALSAHAELGLSAAGFEQAQQFSLNPLRLLDLIAPQPFATALGPRPVALFDLGGLGSLWADSLFVGAPVLALAVAAPISLPRRREVWLLVAVVLLGSLVALGSHTPLYGLLQRWVPLWRGFRYPEKAMAFVSFALCALAGLGGQAALESKRARLATAGGVVICVAAALVGARAGLGDAAGSAGSALLWIAGAGEAARSELGTLMPGLARQCFAGAMLAAAALVLPLQLSLRPAVAAAALVAVVGGTALVGNHDLSRGYRVEPGLVFTAPAVAREMAQKPGRARYLADDPAGCPTGPLKDRRDRTRAWTRLDTSGLVAGKGAEFGLEGIVPYLPLTAAGRAGMAYEQLPDHVLLRAFGVRHHVERVAGARGIDDCFRLSEVPGVGERVRLVQAIPVASAQEAIERARAPGFDPVLQAAVEAQGLATDAPSESGVEVVRYEENALAVEAWSKTPCALFVADRFAPGWTATLDGAEVPIFAADAAARAVALPAGRHRVEMRYRAPGLRAGALLSGLGVGMTVALGVRRRRRPTPASPSRQG
ncbi:MAG TPA: YfhO family protein [Myxococcales bacterium]|jgi:hypothetical protein